jgi:hypothetical protein
MSESTNKAVRERLEALVGEWTIQAGPPGRPRWPGAAQATFEWFEGAPLVIQRWHVDMPEAPDGIAVIGYDGTSGRYYQLYTDERDVQRRRSGSSGRCVWKLWRDGEPFSQRFTGTFSGDGRTITGRWEVSEDHNTWTTDFDIIYTKIQ